MTDFISVSMVMVNNWFLPVKRHEHQDRKCRDPKSNALIMGFYQCVLFWSYRGNLHSLKHIKMLSAKPNFVHDVSELPRLLPTACVTSLTFDPLSVHLPAICDVIQAVGGNLATKKRDTTWKNTGQA